jgi:alpha-ketoglutarate-dependent 2,4-dichlorophenoxyacetate dioxygenase
MSISVAQRHPLFFAAVTGLDLTKPLSEEERAKVVRASDEFGVLVFPGQFISDDDQLRFTQYFGTTAPSITLHREDYARRFARKELSDISNLDEHGEPLDPLSVKRRLAWSTQLWHADGSFRKPSGKYTFLAAKKLPPEGGNTEFADMRAAWDALPEAVQQELLPLHASHSLSYSRQISNSPPLDASEQKQFPPTVQALVRTHPGSKRRSLYLGMHAEYIVGRHTPEGRKFLDEISAHATQEKFVHAHVWQPGDIVMWDNRCCMHRARPFDETRYTREMRRTTVAED